MDKLYLLPLPIAAHRTDTIPAEVNQALQHLNYFFVEDLRTARRFISAMKTGRKIEEMFFFELNKKTTEMQIQEMFRKIPHGESVGLMSEAGCPAVADPGSKAVAYAHQKGIEVVPMSGPSSILLALMASGLNGQSFAFLGYLPASQGDREQKIKQIEKNSVFSNQTQIFIETPYRNNQMLQSLVGTLQHDTLLCVASGISDSNQLISTKPVELWKKMKALPDLHKIPTIFLILARPQETKPQHRQNVRTQKARS
jgi:16S rRNA (cytidine1402-2'-O)-methyltransferase